MKEDILAKNFYCDGREIFDYNKREYGNVLLWFRRGRHIASTGDFEYCISLFDLKRG
jgi:hypothetical protein